MADVSPLASRFLAKATQVAESLASLAAQTAQLRNLWWAETVGVKAEMDQLSDSDQIGDSSLTVGALEASYAAIETVDTAINENGALVPMLNLVASYSTPAPPSE